MQLCDGTALSNLLSYTAKGDALGGCFSTSSPVAKRSVLNCTKPACITAEHASAPPLLGRERTVHAKPNRALAKQWPSKNTESRQRMKLSN